MTTVPQSLRASQANSISTASGILLLQQSQQQPQQHPALQHKASAASVNSTCSVSSNTTSQTFMSTFSFSTVTGRHSRTATHEDDKESVNKIECENDCDNNGHIHENIDIWELDIPSPQENVYSDAHLILSTLPMELSSSRQIVDHVSEDFVDNERLPQRQIARNTCHNKTASQLSSGVLTVKGVAGSQHIFTTDSSTSSPPSPSVPSISSSEHLPSQPISQQQQLQSAEDMMFASPDYRKSMAMSFQSDVAPDLLGQSAGGSSIFVSDASEYSNLLQDATWMIEQQHLQSGHKSSLYTSSSCSSESFTESSTNDTIDRRLNSHDCLTSTLPLKSGIESNIVNPPPSEPEIIGRLPSRRSTTVNSRSRRYSAPGNHYSGQESVSSISRFSATSSAYERSFQSNNVTHENLLSASTSAEKRAPHSIESPQNHPTSSREPTSSIDEKNFEFLGSQNNEQPMKHNIQPLQQHPTTRPYLTSHGYESIDYGVSLGSIINPQSVLSSTTSSNQPQLQRDYRSGVVFEYYEGEWDWLPNFDEMRPDHVGIVGNFMIDDTTEQELFRPQVFTGPFGKRSGFGADGPIGYQPRRPYKESGNFAVRFTTHMDIKQDGVYSFWLSSNDGSVLYISNTLVVENDGVHYSNEVEGRILLQAGKHPMTVEFFHRNGKMLEGFRSTGPSLIVSYRPPGPLWSFGLKAGPKRIIKSSNLFFDYGDIRLRNLLNEYGTDDDTSQIERESGCMSPVESRRSYDGFGQDWRHGSKGQFQQQQSGRSMRHRVMSGDMGQMQLSTRELQVQMENAKTTIKDLEQIIRDQAEDHKKKMRELYCILQDTQGQLDRIVGGIKRVALYEKPRTTIHPTHNSNPAWRSTVVSIYVDAEENYPSIPDNNPYGRKDNTDPNNESILESDEVLAKHLSDVEKLKQQYFFSMALSVKLNQEMMGKATPEYSSTSIQKLYEDCALVSKIPVEGWPGYVSRHFTSKRSPVYEL
ncbi:hypothetical protein FBU30_011076 [Linnemannia zychae]|nr:hypothetical protein FBU30_011076 [Linnemannia zychae]